LLFPMENWIFSLAIASFEFITVTRVLARETYLAEAAGTFELSTIGSDAESASKILRAKAGLADPLRPFGVLLFTGPTGVGKTAGEGHF
jgi:type II secretory ATPase GspE/PulE/Tfp pilus assembly ATPase PilB-like protein